MCEPTDRCIVCDNLFTIETPCCCDYALHTETDMCEPKHPEGVTLHEDGVCVTCCVHPNKIWDGKRAGGGTFERGE